MKVFRRPATSNPLALAARSSMQRAAPPEEQLPYRDRLGISSILVTVNGGPDGWDALDWAAAEAEARRCDLQIVCFFEWHLTVDAYGTMPFIAGDAGAGEAAERIVDDAAIRARAVASTLQISTRIQEGSNIAALRHVREGALLVLPGHGAGGRFETSPFRSMHRSHSWRVARQSGCPVVAVTLAHTSAPAPSAGRVVVGVSGSHQHPAALEFAFQAARRRGVGITALHAWPDTRNHLQFGDPSAVDLQNRAALENPLRLSRARFPDVEVRQRFVPGRAAAAALIAESTGASLLVIGSRRRRLPQARIAPVGRDVLRAAPCPVAIVSNSVPLSNKGN
jgi:nucleotide-binding universal stress UspA family protein